MVASPQPPFEIGQVIEVKIDAQGGHGDGIGHFEGFVIFVSGAPAGKTIKAKITDIKRTYALARQL